MDTDCEKRLMKEFLDGIETNELCKIVRSIYHGGGISANTRQDAELLLMSQPSARVLSNKKVQITTLLKFLISKGLVPTTDLTKADMCLAFKSLVESQPDYIRPPAQPIQMSGPNNMLAISQNNNMMHTYPYQAVQQMPMPVPTPTTSTLEPNKKSRKDRDNELLEEFIEMFAKHFYDLLNDLGTPGKNQLDCRHFYDNCTMSLKILGGSSEICETCEDSTSTLQCLLSIKKEHMVFFSPHLADVKWKKESHGLVKVHIGGTLHQGVGRMVGMFEQQFILREDPQAENTWKILNTNFMMKSMDLITAGPTLSIEGSRQTNNLPIDYV
ncbi:PREDICTED: uncharacterized protein C3orf38 homolog [Diuraphis noxia]|uniref:uncharacterized protein C3orf38 homolog n=1 Tax=Diuraphis noxia TaxID=143948 RepID=UPI0007636E1D|nr:PREDICTED: uncharacterized protein C3orf38 homolog [Diuraphis noxia]